MFQIEQSSTLKELKRVLRSMKDYLQVAGCWREITKLSDKNLLLEDILNFYFVVRMQLPLQRLVLQTVKPIDKMSTHP